MSNPLDLEIIISIDLNCKDSEALDTQTRQLRREILESLDVDSVELSTTGVQPYGAKTGLDPYIVGMIVVVLGPTVLEKFLDFLHAWAMRYENRTIKIKIQAADNTALEVEVPQTMSTTEVQRWITTLRDSLDIKSKNNLKK